MTQKDIFPNLQYKVNSQKIVGELEFCAAHDNKSGELIIDDGLRKVNRLICDVFEIEICLVILNVNGWPKVYEVGKRHCEIAQKCNVEIADLHINPEDNTCCLGIKRPENRTFSIKSFIHERIIPFLYRLSYVEKFGIDVSRNDRWKEYSHSKEGMKEYLAEMINYARSNPGRNSLCPCNSGRKYKKCHFNDVEPLKRYLNGSCPCRSGKKYKECHFNENAFLIGLTHP